MEQVAFFDNFGLSFAAIFQRRGMCDYLKFKFRQLGGKGVPM